ncbi:Zinc metalloproteinase nas-4 [Stylophora pistillata]|uniref:Metalloendopeptidase n=1 Tax=Stylophora pistillata TaxID=50429 RepID=A0A2B4SWZ4_STYPI|nr:Zinc metalloproteinase nas-4 [Stylophora pistillata]
MWRDARISFVLLCTWSILLPVLTDEAFFGKRSSLKAGQGFYDENQYDDGYAEYTGAEKRRFSAMQRRRMQIQNMMQDEPLEKKENMEDILLRELTRGEYNHQNQIEEGVGTAIDDLALRREEEKLKKGEQKRNFDHLPADGDLFEEDIVMDRRLRSWVTGQFDKRDAINDVYYLWPTTLRDGKRIVRVPYMKSEEFTQNPTKMECLVNAISSFNKYTCIRYEPLAEDESADEVDHAHFMVNQSMCYSSVGRQGGRQDISIGDGCERVGTCIHEMMHTIGFIHEQSRPDRDKYVRVFYDRIKQGLEHNFEKYTVREVKTLPSNKEFYDYDSVLHYNNHAFSKDYRDTIESRDNPDRRFGQRESFSKHDIKQINELYGCDVENLKMLLQDVPYN